MSCVDVIHDDDITCETLHVLPLPLFHKDIIIEVNFLRQLYFDKIIEPSINYTLPN